MLYIEGKKNIIKKRIGSTTYKVSVHFNQNSRETMNDKILRLIQSDPQTSGAVCGTMDLLQMDRLPERSPL